MTKEQAIALHRVFHRAQLFWDGDGMMRNLDNAYEGNNLTALTFEEFVNHCQFSQDCIMVPWCGIWLGIEQDGYTHS